MNRRTALTFSPGAAGPLLREGHLDLSWQDRALCAETDPEIFHPEKGGSVLPAKRVCLGCDVRAECLEYALATDQRYGIWGGMSERERRRLRRATADAQPSARRCMKGLHVMTAENTIGTGWCRACKQAADSARHCRNWQGLAA